MAETLKCRPEIEFNNKVNNMDRKRNFSIFIPTYNRQERLIRELRSILIQKESEEIEIVLLDNHSNYDVNKAINDAFPDREIKVISYPINIGGALNINMPFFYCKTKWLWILSDDDEVKKDSLKTIFEDIDNNPNIGVFKYSFDGFFNASYKDELYYSLEDLAGLTGKSTLSGLVWCSNAVYNMDVLSPFRGDIVRFAYNNIGAYLPVYYMLDSKAGVLFSREKNIISYVKGEEGNGTGWNSLDLYLESGTFFDYQFKASGKLLRELWGNGLVPFQDFMKQLENRNLHKDKIKCQLYFDKVFPYYLKRNFIERCCIRLIFYIYKFFGLNLANHLL